MTLEETQELEVIRVPFKGIPEVIDSLEKAQAVAVELAQTSGLIALDAERASGFRYSQRAYLIQCKRGEGPIYLLDPIAIGDLSSITQVVNHEQWILHAASQDLNCLREVGFEPLSGVLDTELAGRLLGLPKVALGTLLLELLEISLAKEHSAADWSTRPLPEEWLAYAALDVEFLLPLWSQVEALLIEANKLEWAKAEFAHVVATTKPIKREEPWRRMSGLHQLKTPRQLAIARELWLTRDEIASRRDIAPGRIFADRFLVELALAPADTDFAETPALLSRGGNRNRSKWLEAIARAHALSEEQLPERNLKSDGPPSPKSWSHRDPENFACLEAARAEISALAQTLVMPPENLLSPDALRRCIWAHPTTRVEVIDQLDLALARSWQIELVTDLICNALVITD
jgi:ribonuclease D